MASLMENPSLNSKSHHPQPPKKSTKVSTVNRTKDPWWGLTSETAIGTQTQQMMKFDASTIRKHWGPNIVCILRTTKLPYLLASHWIEIFLGRMLLTKSEMTV